MYRLRRHSAQARGLPASSSGESQITTSTTAPSVPQSSGGREVQRVTQPLTPCAENAPPPTNDRELQVATRPSPSRAENEAPARNARGVQGVIRPWQPSAENAPPPNEGANVEITVQPAPPRAESASTQSPEQALALAWCGPYVNARQIWDRVVSEVLAHKDLEGDAQTILDHLHDMRKGNCRAMIERGAKDWLSTPLGRILDPTGVLLKASVPACGYPACQPAASSNDSSDTDICPHPARCREPIWLLRPHELAQFLTELTPLARKFRWSTVALLTWKLDALPSNPDMAFGWLGKDDWEIEDSVEVWETKLLVSWPFEKPPLRFYRFEARARKEELDTILEDRIVGLFE